MTRPKEGGGRCGREERREQFGDTGGIHAIFDCRLPIDDLEKALTAEDAENAETIELLSRGLRSLRVEGPVGLLGASLTPAECRGPSLGVVREADDSAASG